MARRAEPQRAYRRLIGGLAFFELTHTLGLASASLWLLPGLSPSLPLATRAAYVSSNVGWWRLGWLPWHLSAASDVWVAAALVGWTRALEAPRARRWALAGVAFLLLAIVPEQYAEAALALQLPNLPFGQAWHEQLGLYLWLLGTWANAGYTLMTACWLLAVRSLAADLGRAAPPALGAKAAVPSGVWPLWAESLLLLLFSAASLTNHYAWSPRPGLEPARAFQLTSLLNGLAFPGLLLLGAAVAARAGDWQERQTRAGADAAARPSWPKQDARLGRWLAMLAGAPGLRDLVRAFQSWLPFPTLRSDVRDVLYLNWLVDAQRLEARIPEGLRVRRFGDSALLSILVFRHGHFGPALLGPLRKLLPSPIQCNARAYVDAPPLHVTFLANSIDQAAYFLGSRLLSDGLPAHYPAAARLQRVGSSIEVAIDPGVGSALALRAQAEETSQAELPRSFARHFTDFQAAVGHIVPQNAALRRLPTIGRWSESRIVVDAPLEDARACRLLGPIELGPPLAELVEGAEPLVFSLARAHFAAVGEALWREPDGRG